MIATASPQTLGGQDVFRLQRSAGVSVFDFTVDA